jgi:uncharacterized membrane protein
MTRIIRSVEIEAPVEEVFKYAADWRLWADWFVGVSDFVPTTEVSSGNGARYLYKAQVMGIPVRVETEIQNFVENEGWSGVATRGMPHRTKWIFESEGEATRFTYVLDYQFPIPLLGPLIDKYLLRKEWERILGRSLRNLREHFAAIKSPG